MATPCMSRSFSASSSISIGSDRDAVRAADVPDTLDEAVLRWIDDLSDAAQALSTRGVGDRPRSNLIHTLAGVTGETVDVVWPVFGEARRAGSSSCPLPPGPLRVPPCIDPRSRLSSAAAPGIGRDSTAVWPICWPNGAMRRTRPLPHHCPSRLGDDEAFRSSLLAAEVAVGDLAPHPAKPSSCTCGAMRNLPADLPALELADVLAPLGAEAAATR